MDNEEKSLGNETEPDIKRLLFEQTFKLTAISILFETYDNRKRTGSTDLIIELRNFQRVHGTKRYKVEKLLSDNPYPFIQTIGLYVQIDSPTLRQYHSINIQSDNITRNKILKWEQETTPLINEIEKEDTTELLGAYSLYSQTVAGIIQAFTDQINGEI